MRDWILAAVLLGMAAFSFPAFAEGDHEHQSIHELERKVIEQQEEIDALWEALAAEPPTEPEPPVEPPIDPPAGPIWDLIPEEYWGQIDSPEPHLYSRAYAEAERGKAWADKWCDRLWCFRSQDEIITYSGSAVSPEGLVVLSNGGHASSSMNGGMRLNFATGKWERLYSPAEIVPEAVWELADGTQVRASDILGPAWDEGFANAPENSSDPWAFADTYANDAYIQWLADNDIDQSINSHLYSLDYDGDGNNDLCQRLEVLR